VGDDPDDHLEEHEPDDQRERDRQIPPIGIGGDAMRVTTMIVMVIVAIMVVAVMMMMRVIVGHCC
jgi:hypothetical protein